MISPAGSRTASLSVFENVLAGHYMAGCQTLLGTFLPTARVRRQEQAVRESATDVVQRLGLARRMNALAHLLSCGELRLLEVAVALGLRC